MTTGKPSSPASLRPPAVRWACLLGTALTGGWLAATAAAVNAGLGADAGGGEWAALGVLVVGFLALGVLAGSGSYLAWNGGQVRRLATAGLCTVVVCGWRVVAAIVRGFADLDSVDVGMIALFLFGAAILVLLRGQR